MPLKLFWPLYRPNSQAQIHSSELIRIRKDSTTPTRSLRCILSRKLYKLNSMIGSNPDLIAGYLGIQDGKNDVIISFEDDICR